MVAAVDEVASVTLSGILRRIRLCNHDERVGTAGGGSRVGRIDMFSRLHARIGTVHLPRPRTGKGCKHILCRIKVDLGTHQAIQTNHLLALIEENGASHNRIALCVDVIMKF